MEILEMNIDFPGGERVDARLESRLIPTDQPPPYGEGSAPAPFDLFLASIGTCAGIYVLSFCRERDIPTEGVLIMQRMEFDDSVGMMTKVELEIQVPPDFPKKYYKALVRSANQCAVKKHLATPPKFEVYTKVIEEN